jgi:hypothetical protein
MKLASVLTLVVTLSLATNASGWAQSAEPSTASPNISDPTATSVAPYGAVIPGSSGKPGAKPGLMDPLGAGSTTSRTNPSDSSFGNMTPSSAASPLLPAQQPYGSTVPLGTGTPIR